MIQTPNDDRDHGLVAAAQAASGGESVKYSVQPVTRFLVIREDPTRPLSFEVVAEFGEERMAHRAATAMCQAEHRSLGYPIDDPRIQYPVRDVSATKI